jgi:predicted transcriptional regulator
MSTSEHNNTGTVTITVRTSRQTKEQLDTLAENMGRSANYLVGEAISSYVSENAWQVEAIGKAVAEADAGGPSISQEATERWLKSWGSDHELPKPEPDTFS